MRTRARRGIAAVAGMAVLSLVAAACGGGSSSGTPSAGSSASGTAVKGGVLKLVGDGDVDYMDTADAYYDVSFTLMRAITRQLYTYPNSTDYNTAITVVPDLATGMPKITNGGKTYTIQIRSGAQWDTSPPRPVTAQDVIRGLQRLCNPVLATAPAGYYADLIVGMKSYCSGADALGAKVTAAQLGNYINSHSVSGLKAVNSSTVQIKLVQPAADFTNILAMPFASPAPKEYLNYLPASPQLAQNFISDGPYKMASYKPAKSIDLVRNPAWQESSDPVRHAYVNEIQITEGVADPNTVQQQIQAGTADMDWDQIVPTADLAHLSATNDPGLVVGPSGNNYISINPYIAINLQSPNNGGALKNVKVRQAIEYAINKTAASKIYGGSIVSIPLGQTVPPGSQGNIPGYDPYATPGSNGDPTKAKQLLQQAGYKPGQITLKLPYRTNTVHPQIAQSDQAALQKAGFNVKLITATPDGFYTKYMQNPTAGKSGAWDIGEAGWNPDWLGPTNARSIIPPLFDGRGYGPGSTDYGDYNSAAVNADIDRAESASSPSAATTAWQAAAKKIMEDAAFVPLGSQKVAVYHSSRVKNCIFNTLTENCDITDVWLSGS